VTPNIMKRRKCEIPQKNPAIIILFKCDLNDSSTFYEYLSKIMFYWPKEETVLIFIIDSATIPADSLYTESSLPLNPAIKFISMIPAKTTKGIMAVAISPVLH